MAIHPIDYRYGTPEMRAIWSEENRFACIVQTEIALARAGSEFGLVPQVAADIIERNASLARLSRAKEIEAEINHDMMAIVKAVAEVCGEAGGWVHYGATSNDILDTATGLQLKASLEFIGSKLRTLLTVLIEKSHETRYLVCAARTHGQIGVPITYGLRFGIWASKVGRHLDRLSEITPRIAVGQLFRYSVILSRSVRKTHSNFSSSDSRSVTRKPWSPQLKPVSGTTQMPVAARR